MNTRRSFLKVMGTGTAFSAVAFPSLGVTAQMLSEGVSNDQLAQKESVGKINSGAKKYPISFFTKTLDNYEMEFMAESLAMAGVDGFDLAVREGGRVNPAHVEDELPKVIEAGRKYNLSTGMMVTDIKGIGTPFAEKVLQTAAHYGIKHYRMGPLEYDFKQGIWESLSQHKKDILYLLELNEKYGIQGSYQNHTGARIGSPVWDLWELMRDYPVELISNQFDICHAMAEGAASWILSMRLLSKHIGSLAIKDFTWQVENRKAKLICVPLGQGIVDFDKYFTILKELDINVPITLHIEYPFLSKDEENLSLLEKQKIIAGKLKHDVEFIRGYLNQFQLL